MMPHSLPLAWPRVPGLPLGGEGALTYWIPLHSTTIHGSKPPCPLGCSPGRDGSKSVITQRTPTFRPSHAKPPCSVGPSSAARARLQWAFFAWFTPMGLPFVSCYNIPPPRTRGAYRLSKRGGGGGG